MRVEVDGASDGSEAVGVGKLRQQVGQPKFSYGLDASCSVARRQNQEKAHRLPARSSTELDLGDQRTERNEAAGRGSRLDWVRASTVRPHFGEDADVGGVLELETGGHAKLGLSGGVCGG